MNGSRASVAQYVRYVAVALVAFVATVASREVFQRMLPGDTPAFYTLSMVLAYCLGIVVNFTLQRALTFRSTNRSWGMFSGFVLVALAGAAVTTASSLAFRYLVFDHWFERWSPTLGFAGGNVVASVTTYVLNARFVFRDG